MNDLTVVTTGAGALALGTSLITSLKNVKERKINVIACDTSQECGAKYIADKFFVAPRSGTQEYMNFMVDLCRKEKVDVILPGIIEDLLMFAENKKQFSDLGIIIPSCTLEVMRIAIDKLLTYEFLKKSGLPHAEFFAPSSAEEFKDMAFRLGYPEKPVVMKPRLGAGMRGVRILKENKNKMDTLIKSKPDSTIASLDEIYNILIESSGKFPEIVLMEYLPGKDYSIYSLADNGSPIYTIPMERLKPTSFVPSMMSRIDDVPEVVEEAEKIIKRMGLNSNTNLQMKYNSDGKPILYEINPRLAGTIILCNAAGIDLPYFGIKLVLEEPFPRDLKPKYGTLMVRYIQEVFTYNGNSFYL